MSAPLGPALPPRPTRKPTTRPPAAGGRRLAPLLLTLLTLLAAPAALAQRRPGSQPMPPVRNVPIDRADPISPPPAGTTDPGRPQVPGSLRRPVPARPSTAQPGTARPAARPAVQPAGADLTQATDSSAADSLRLSARRKDGPETTLKYAAKDSIQFDVTQKVARLYNKASVDYGATELKAALITVDYGRNQLYANGKRDSVTNKLEGRPVFKDAAGLYTADDIAYNTKTKKGRISGVVTQQGEGYVHADVVKKMANNDTFGKHGYYTTCNLEHPHFYIQAQKMKVVPGKKVITGPFNIVIGGVPLPIGLPFGYFPTPLESRGSGVIIPTFGQALDRGYFLTNGGYYWAPNDYLGLRVTGDIYAGNGRDFGGGWGGRAELTYRKRYTYDGLFSFEYSKRPTNQLLPTTGVSTSPDFLRPQSANTFWVRWNHAPVPKPGGGRFSASVQAGSTSYNIINRLEPRQRLTPQFNSSITYAKQLRNSPFNYTVRLSQSQGTQTGRQDFTLPDFSLGMARVYPYELLGIKPGGRLGGIYEQIAVSYNLVGQNLISNTVGARGLEGGLPLLGGAGAERQLPIDLRKLGPLLRNSRNGLQHQLGINLGSYSKWHFNVAPSISYGETWYFQRLNYIPIRAAQAVRVDTIPGFFRANTYSAGLTVGTTFYGLLRFKGKDRRIDAIRHKVTPNLSYSYSPDLVTGSSAYQNVLLGAGPGGAGLTDANGQSLAPRDFSRFQGFVYGTPGGQRASLLNFSLQNSVEMKVRDKNDTTGTTPFKKINLIRNLDFNTSYNLVDTSFFKLANLNFGFNTDIANRLSVSITGSLSPYQRDSTGRLLERYLVQQSRFRLARLENANISLNYAFNPASGKRRAVVPRTVAPSNDPTLGTVGPPGMYADYIDFDIPWELSLGYAASYSTARQPLRERRPAGQLPLPLLANSALQATGSVKLSENLKLNLTGGFDFNSATITSPFITFYRDLHCWQIAGNWIPFGQVRGYFLSISAKSSLLQDLKLDRNRQVNNR